jgi:arylsulfatase A-like enzyme
MRAYEPPWLMLLHIWEVHRPFRPPPDHIKRWDRAGYEAVVAAADERLSDVFSAAGNNTIVVITGDHGEEYAESRLDRLLNRTASRARRVLKPSKWFSLLDRKLSARTVGHGFALYEHLVKVPLIISGPGVAPMVVDEQVRHVDLLPTLADLCGIDAGSDVDGRSLRPLMEGGSLPEEPAYMEAVGVKLEGKRIVGVRTPDWKLLKPGSGKPSLFRLDGDGSRAEKRNLYRRYPEVARRLEGFIERIASSERAGESGMSSEEEAIVEQHLKDLGYL